MLLKILGCIEHATVAVLAVNIGKSPCFSKSITRIVVDVEHFRCALILSSCSSGPIRVMILVAAARP